MQKVLVLPSKEMDSNKKENRDEHSLLRMPKATRNTLKLDNESFSIEGDIGNKNLNVFKAFSKDLKKAKKLVETTDIGENALEKVCFVSTKVFKQLGGTGNFLEASLVKEALDILIGTDPELLIMSEGNVVAATNIPGFTKQAQFGSDGAMAEIRPDPSKTAEGLVKNIKSLFNNDTLTNPVNNYDWKSACYFETTSRDYPVGIHIHFDNPKQLASMNIHKRQRLFAVTNKIVDELLTLPMIRLDGKEGHKRRARCKMSTHNGYNTANYGKGYGFFGEWRTCNGRLEHRSLSGLVLLNPEVCAAVFGTAKAITEAVYKEAIKQGLDDEFILPSNLTKTNIYNSTFDSWGTIPLAETFNCCTSSGAISKSMNKSSRSEITKKYINKWLASMRGLSTYSKYENNIEMLGDLLVSSSKTLDSFTKNIKNTWKD